MFFPCSTGEGAKLLGTSEPRLAETVRRGRLKPSPPIIAGRRLWSPLQLRTAAQLLGVLTNEIEDALRDAIAATDRAAEAAPPIDTSGESRRS